MTDSLKDKLNEAMRTEDFPTLLKRFDTSGCGSEAFNIATWMFTRFRDESMKMLPLIKDEQLTCDGSGNHPATTHEWAAALVAAKKIKLETGHPVASVTEKQAHESIAKIYSENHKGAAGCRIP